MDMKKRFRAVLTSNVNPVLFACSCLLLISVLVVAWASAESICSDADEALEWVALPIHFH
jgi:hypothetical protein